ncbi:MAG: DeoR/GlpR family DNA-binding transcription regulator [Microbacterium sp.]
MTTRATTTARHDDIRERLGRAQRVHVADLAARFEVSEETIRRDLLALEREGAAVRVHGGAIAPAATVEADPARVSPGDVLVEAALSELPEAGSVLIGSGPVSRALAEALPDRADRTIITSSVDIAQLAAVKARTIVYNLGGSVRRSVRGGDAQFGPWTNELMADLRVDSAVVETGALGSDGAVIAETPQLAEQIRLVLQTADRLVLVVTGSLCDDGLVAAANVADFDIVVAREGLPGIVAARADEGGVRVIVPEPAT